ncbi:MAG: TIGR01459 family HAD-type hydrolase [Pseudomonadota bacterium]|nr:TIGR01459 family HAD-type hydrolase [Pseudomonadota bacterium]
MSKTKFCQGISDISDSYNAFIIDQWGVLHNGEKVYDGVLDCLKELKQRKKYIIILSNSGKRADDNKERMKKLGIGPTMYDEIITSGEMTWQGLKNQDEGVFKNLGERCFLMSRGGDTSIIDGLDNIELVDQVEDADFLLISGSEAPEKTLVDYYEPLLKKAIRKQIKAVCANPDSRILIGNNHTFGPGMIARRYQDFGGVVHYIGKPHKPIFQYCIQRLQKQDIYPGQTVMVGDTMAHDIIGAAGVEIDTCMVKNGIHYGSFKGCSTPYEVDRALNILVLQYHNIRPTYLVDKMKWGKALPDRKHKKRAG